MKQKISTADFIKRSISVHGLKYDYSKSEYTGALNKVCIVCPEHGLFWLQPNHHWNGKGCPKCKSLKLSINNAKTKDLFIEESLLIHGQKYDYSLVEYKNNKTPVTIVCLIHGLFSQTPAAHICNKEGCPECGKIKATQELTRTNEEFCSLAEGVHKNYYSYKEVHYINYITPIIITCPKHGDFLLTPHKHLMGQGCPKCKLKSQTILFNKICQEFPKDLVLFEVNKNELPWLDNLRLDIYFPKYNIAIEYDGELHFMPIKHFGGELQLSIQKESDKQKELKCLDNLCKLFRVKYDYKDEDFNNLVNNIREIINKQNEVI